MEDASDNLLYLQVETADESAEEESTQFNHDKTVDKNYFASRSSFQIWQQAGLNSGACITPRRVELEREYYDHTQTTDGVSAQRGGRAPGLHLGAARHRQVFARRAVRVGGRAGVRLAPGQSARARRPHRRAADRGRTSRFCPPRSIARKEPYCLFLDELNACSHEVHKAFYSLIHERRLGEYLLPEGSNVIGAGNRAQDSAIVKPMSSALLNRMVHVHLKASHREWLEWAGGEGVHALAVASAVNVAAGVESHLGAYSNKFSEAQRARAWFINSYPLLGALAAAFEIIEDPLVCTRMVALNVVVTLNY